MSDHTPLLNDVAPTPDAGDRAGPAAIPNRDIPPRQFLADQTPFLSDAHLAARQAADQTMFESYPNAYVAFVDTWDGPRLSRDVVVAAERLADFYSRLDRLDPDVRRRAEVNRTPDPDHLQLPLFLLG